MSKLRNVNVPKGSILVQILERDKEESGLLGKERSVDEMHQIGEVVNVHDSCDDIDKKDFIYFSNHIGQKITLEDESYIVINEDDVFLIIKTK